ncbi:MAG: trigger factor [Dehalococcoidia bacterium]
MKVSTEKIPESQVLMTIEVEPERLEEARGKALRKLAPRAKVPGFRPGKAPPAMILRYLGEDRVLDEALDALVPLVYREAVEADQSIDPIARPRLVIETTDPLVVKATIPVRPTVDLGAYTAVRVQAQPVTVEESRVDETLETLRHRASTLEPMDRELRWHDVLTMDVKADVEGEPLVDEQDVQIQLAEDRDVLFPGFEEALLGHHKADTITFDLPVPEEVTSEKFAGKQARFAVAIKETKAEVLPPLDDDFAKQVGDGYPTVDALRDRVRADIQTYEEGQRARRYHEEILVNLVDRATIEYPPVMLASEIDRMLHEQAGHIEEGRGLEAYLASLGKTEEQVREEFRPIADMRLRRSLILTEVSEAEHIQVSDQEVDEEIDRMTASAGAQAPQMRQLFSSDSGRDTIRRRLLTEKTLARLVEIATQDEGSAAAPAEHEQPQQKKPRAKRTRPPAAAAQADPDTDA